MSRFFRKGMNQRGFNKGVSKLQRKGYSYRKASSIMKTFARGLRSSKQRIRSYSRRSRAQSRYKTRIPF